MVGVFECKVRADDISLPLGEGGPLAVDEGGSKQKVEKLRRRSRLLMRGIKKLDRFSADQAA